MPRILQQELQLNLLEKNPEDKEGIACTETITRRFHEKALQDLKKEIGTLDEQISTTTIALNNNKQSCDKIMEVNKNICHTLQNELKDLNSNLAKAKQHAQDMDVLSKKTDLPQEEITTESPIIQTEIQQPISTVSFDLKTLQRSYVNNLRHSWLLPKLSLQTTVPEVVDINKTKTITVGDVASKLKNNPLCQPNMEPDIPDVG